MKFNSFCVVNDTFYERGVDDNFETFYYPLLPKNLRSILCMKNYLH